MIIIISQISRLADHANLEIAPEPGFANARVPDRGFNTRVRADQQQGICVFHTHQRRVEDVAFTHAVSTVCGAFRTAVGILDAQSAEQVESGLRLLDFDQVSGDNADLFSWH